MHVGIYTRVSTTGQVDGESLPEQERHGRAWAERHGHHVVAVYTDAGRSGALPVTERQGLADALEALETGSIAALVMRDLDRLARSVTVQEAVLAQVWLTPGSKVFTFHGEVHRDDPDDPMRTAMREMAGVFAGLERRVIVKRLRDGRRAKARRGEHANGPAPYGWATRDGDLYPVPEELAVLDRMRSLRTDGATQTQIAEALNEAGHPARNGGRWTQPVVSRILVRDAARTPEQVSHHADRLAATACHPRGSRESLSPSRPEVGWLNGSASDLAGGPVLVPVALGVGLVDPGTDGGTVVAGACLPGCGLVRHRHPVPVVALERGAVGVPGGLGGAGHEHQNTASQCSSGQASLRETNHQNSPCVWLTSHTISTGLTHR